ncbi:MAG: hypothetical protein K2Q33_05615, partial [Gammaproteobacteria bacterium]|nr:hypothetical protein [Gammaproteobacteria bacterium]
REVSTKIQAIQQAFCDDLFDFKALMLQLENAKLLCKHIHGSEKKESYELVLKKLEDQINSKKRELETPEKNIFRSLLSRSSQGNQPPLQNNASTLSSFFKKPKSNSHDLPNSSKQNANRH